MKKFEEHTMGEIPSEPKKRGRKSKKQLEKELLLDYKFENDVNESLLNKSYNMMQYLSSREKKTFEEKFTVPKNGIQREYHN